MSQAVSGFVPGDLDASTWDAVAPLFGELAARNVNSSGEMERWLVDRSELEAACSEAGARVYINMTCDTGDEEAAAAYTRHITEVQPKLREFGFVLDRRQVELSERFGLTGGRYAVLHRDTATEVELFREENVAVLTELDTLGQRYDTITGGMEVEFRGERLTLPRMARFQESPERVEREEAWRATAARRLSDRDAIDDVYDSMVHLRHTLACNAGLESYTEYAFRAKKRFDYTPETCEAFHRAVEEVVMPFCAGLDERRREALGLEALRPWDLAVDPKGRSPLRPFEGGAELVSRARRVFESLDAGLAELFAGLGDGTNEAGISSGELLDLDSRAGKAPGGYQYMLDRSRRPFIFMNAAGLHRDVETMVHEAGHAFHSLLCVEEPLLHYRSSPIEFAEVASMSMELLTMRHWGVRGGFYEDAEDLARAQRKQLEGTLSLLPWIATIDAFQHWVYANPRHTRAERAGAWDGLMERFGFAGHRVSWDEETAESRRTRWQAQGHLFGAPFYYIEYGIAQLGALQLWAVSLEEGEAAALERYKRALSLGGSRPLPELFEAAGLTFDFGASTVGRLRELVERELSRIAE